MKDIIEKEAERILLEGYEKYYRLAYSYMGNEADALDAVQESALKVIRECGKVKEKSYLGTWIYRIVINTCLDMLRKRKKETIGIDKADPKVQGDYNLDDPMELLQSLEEPDKTIVKLKIFEELKLSEIGEILNMNVNTVKARLYRALKKLRVELESHNADGKERR